MVTLSDEKTVNECSMERLTLWICYPELLYLVCIKLCIYCTCSCSYVKALQSNSLGPVIVVSASSLSETSTLSESDNVQNVLF